MPLPHFLQEDLPDLAYSAMILVAIFRFFSESEKKGKKKVCGFWRSGLGKWKNKRGIFVLLEIVRKEECFSMEWKEK